MTIVTYTILNRHGDVLGEGETLKNASLIVLGYDGYEHEVRRAADRSGFDLWTSTFSRNSSAYNGLAKSRIFSLEADEQLALADIYRQVIRNASWWSNCEVMTDDDYAKTVAEMSSAES